MIKIQNLCMLLLCITWITKSTQGFNFFKCPSEDHGTLEHVSIIHRHGDRTPIFFYPLDPHINHNWMGGFGQLTNKGKQVLYEVGKYLRRRYGHLIGLKYDRHFINVTSSEFDRALMSAYSLLAGLFPPEGEQMWNKNLLWQPIPVRSLPMNIDKLIATTAPCPRYSYERQQLEKHPFFFKLREQNRGLYEKISKNTGLEIPESILDTVQMISFVYDVLFVQETYGLKLPDWSKYVYPFPLQISALQHFKNRVFTDTMKRLSAGPLISHIISVMRRRIDNRRTKMHIYSGHDNTVSGIMIALDCFNDILVPYGSLLMFELRKKNEKYYVLTLFKNTTTEKLYPLRVKGCREFCPFEEFVERTKPVVPENWEKECEMGYFWNQLPYFNLLNLDIIIAVLFFFIGLYNCVFENMLKKKKILTSRFFYFLS